MSSFSFGFDLEDSGSGHFPSSSAKISEDMRMGTEASDEEVPEKSQHPAVEVHCPVNLTVDGCTTSCSELRFLDKSSNELVLLKVLVDQHPEKVHSVSIPLNHDIVPSIYGGGYKTWECSMDLTQYVLRNLTASGDASLLELGCGHGLPSIAALRHLGYTTGVLNDLNAEVMRDTTWPNLAFNGVANRRGDFGPVRCIAGHWENLSEQMGSQTFETILSAETAYSATNATLLVDLVRRHLSPTGSALVATKRFYFGLGGGTACLEAAAAAAGIACKVVWSAEDGTSNVRDICLLSR